MSISIIILMVIFFVAPSIYQRLHFYMRESDFLKISFRKKIGLQIHHGHWGLIWIFLSSLLLIFFDKNIYIILLSMFGWGLLMDEIIPNLQMPSNDRVHELEVYKKSLKPTIFLLVAVIILFTIIYIFR